MTDILTTARRAYRAGLSILPTCEDGSKRPDVSTWKDFQTTPPSVEQLRAWDFGHRHGLGVIAGPASQIDTWDFDCNETFQAFCDAAVATGLGDLVNRIRCGYEDRTPAGGVRWLVHYPDGMPWMDCTLARRPGRDGEPAIKTLIELPTFAIIAPSHGSVHPSGKPYVHVSGDMAQIASYILEERTALVQLARTFDQLPRPDVHPHERRTATTGPRRPGDDYNDNTTWPDVLGPAGWEPVYERNHTTYWRRPAKSHGISATTNHAGSDLLFVFSSSTPFEPDRSYTRFGAYAVLEHHGDYRAAAVALAKQGFGTAATRFSSPPSTRTPGPTTDAAWPTPLDDCAFIGLCGRLVRTIETQTEADVAGLLVQHLAMFGNCVGRGPHFCVEADTHFLNLDVVLVGLTAKGRKGVSTGQVRRTYLAADPDWVANCHKSGLSSGEGLVWAVRDPIEKQTPIKHRGRILGYETEIIDHGVVDKRLFVLEPEFASTLRVMAREGNTLSALIRQAWDGLPLRVLTKNSPATATKTHISIVAHITRDELRRYLEATEAANGFGNRFLWVCVSRVRCLPDGGRLVPVDVETVRERVQWARTVGEIRRDRDARRLWHRVYGRLSEGRLGMLGAMTARAEAQVMRLAALYALTDRQSVVGVAHLRAALEVWRYAFESVRYIFGRSLGHPLADELLRAIQPEPAGLTRSELSRDVLARNRSTAEVTEALGALETAGLVRRVMEKGTGVRAIERWIAVPQDAFAEEDIDYDIYDIYDISNSTADQNVVNVVNVVTPTAPSESVKALPLTANDGRFSAAVSVDGHAEPTETTAKLDRRNEEPDDGRF